MVNIGYWSVSEEEFADIVGKEGVGVDEFNKDEFDALISESLCDPGVGGGDPWRVGMNFHVERVLRYMREHGSLKKEA